MAIFVAVYVLFFTPFILLFFYYKNLKKIILKSKFYKFKYLPLKPYQELDRKRERKKREREKGRERTTNEK